MCSNSFAPYATQKESFMRRVRERERENIDKTSCECLQGCHVRASNGLMSCAWCASVYTTCQSSPDNLSALAIDQEFERNARDEKSLRSAAVAGTQTETVIEFYW